MTTNVFRSINESPRGYNYRFDALVHRAAMTIGPRRMRRDVRGMLDALVAEGRAAWLGEGLPRTGAGRSDDTLRAALAVAGLFSRRG